MLKSKWIQRLAGGRLERIANSVLSSAQMRFLRMHKDPEILRDIRNLRKKLAAPLANESFLLRSLATSLNQLPGDFAEVSSEKSRDATRLAEVHDP